MTQKGFTMIDFLVSVSVFLSVLGLVSVSLLSSRNKAAVGGEVTLLVSDMRSQQLKAMLGDTEGRSAADVYGIHFDVTQYVLFHGPAYVAGSVDNFVVTLPDDLVFANNVLPAGNVIFSRGSGEIVGYMADQDTVQLVSGGAGKTKSIEFNRYGTMEVN